MIRTVLSRWRHGRLRPGLLGLAVLLVAGSAALAARPVEPPDAIGHVVVIYQENQAFDTYFGTFPGADGLRDAGAAAVQVDRDGRPYDRLPRPLADGPDGLRGPDSRFPADLPNQPFLFNRYVPPSEETPGLVHAFYTQQYQIDGGRMDKFIAWGDSGGLVMGYWDTSALPLWRLATEYTLADRFFHAAFGGSFLNHMWLACACSPTFPAAPSELVSTPYPGYPDHLRDGELTPDRYAVNTMFSVNSPHPADAPAKYLLPSQNAPTIGDRLSAAGVSWAWYAGGWNDAIAGHPDRLFQFHHQPFAYFANYADGTPGRASHLKDEADFLQALKDGTLPAVSFVKPLGPENEHPGYATVERGQQHVLGLVQAVQASSVWKDTVIIITYDENGGAWDHVPPPVVDRWGPGARVPTVIVSPLAKRGYVDHTTYDTTAILKLIERRWKLDPLGPRDAAAADLTNALNLPGRRV